MRLSRLGVLLKLVSLDSFVKFSGVGAFITIASMFSTFFWLKIVGTSLFTTYFINYTVFILLSYFLNCIFTFKSRITLASLAMYYIVYFSGLLLGMLLLYLFKLMFVTENWVYAFITLPFTLTSNYLFSAVVFHKTGKQL